MNLYMSLHVDMTRSHDRLEVDHHGEVNRGISNLLLKACE